MDSFHVDGPTATRYWDVVNFVFLLHCTAAAAATTTTTRILVDNAKVAVAAPIEKTSKQIKLNCGLLHSPG